jgi:hypothetical protein
MRVNFTSFARIEGSNAPDDKDRQRLRERLKDVEKRLQKHQPVALKWKEAGKVLMVRPHSRLHTYFSSGFIKGDNFYYCHE